MTARFPVGFKILFNAEELTICYRLRSIRICVILLSWENQRAKAAYPPFIGGATLQTDEERRALSMYVTYADLIQLLIFIVALVGLVYEIFKDRRNLLTDVKHYF